MAARASLVAAVSLIVFGVFWHRCEASTDSTGARSIYVDYAAKTLVKDGQPFRYISGSIHYSRVRAVDWKDRLTKMYAAGLNAIQTYVPWNFHEVNQGIYDFSGDADLPTFLQTAQDIGLLVILRPGPYICAEWEFGGLPWYLLQKNASCHIRSMDKDYISATKEWMTVLLSKLRPFMYHNGGPIITVQVENEYGSYFECDRKYQAFLVDLYLTTLGPETVLFTTDGAGANYLKCGAIEGVLTTVDFGTGNASAFFQALVDWQPNGPLTNSEYYTGWLDLWGGKHAHVDSGAACDSLNQILQLGANVNMYMFFGGTNFGYTNGAEGTGSPQVTSYDYDAPISEAGDLTPKYFALREVIGKYNPLPKIAMPSNSTKYAYGNVSMVYVSSVAECASILSSGRLPVNSMYPLTMEQLDQGNGYMLYKHAFEFSGVYNLTVSGIRDRGYVTMNNQMEFVSILDRHLQLKVNVTAKIGDVLEIFVENQGRVNYGNGMLGNTKGIISNVTALSGKSPLIDWEMNYINLERMDSCIPLSKPGPMHPPAIYRAEFTVKAVGDTFLKMTGWTKGQVLINGFNLGRYWPAKGPQQTLYVPWSVLRVGTNMISILELMGAPCGPTFTPGQCSVQFVDQPLLGPVSTQSPVGRWQ